MRIATWNINSIRTRHARAIDWMLREDVDVVAFQEIKCKPEQFPYEAFQDAVSSDPSNGGHLPYRCSNGVR